MFKEQLHTIIVDHLLDGPVVVIERQTRQSHFQRQLSKANSFAQLPSWKQGPENKTSPDQ